MGSDEVQAGSATALGSVLKVEDSATALGSVLKVEEESSATTKDLVLKVVELGSATAVGSAMPEAALEEEVASADLQRSRSRCVR